MELGIQNLDNFKDFFLNQSIQIDIYSFLISLLLSAILALLVKYVYLKCAMTLSNKSYFSDLFVPLSITTTLVITVIKFSLALSLGLVGALSIVRFRAAIKEPEELVYLFLIIAFGIAFGASQFAVGFTLLFFSLLIIYLANKFSSESSLINHTGVLCIITGDKNSLTTYRKKELTTLLNNVDIASLKELTYEGNIGKLVIKLSLSNVGTKFIDEVENSIQGYNLDFNLISDISVPA